MIRVGLLGCGAIGRDHARRIHESIAGMDIVAVYDVFEEGAKKAIENIPGAKICATSDELIESPDVDAIVICSIDSTHEPLVLKCIEVGKPVFVEKPMADTPEGAKRIVDAEIACGKKLVQVGFMRRYDVGYRALKEHLDSKVQGEPLIAHCAHRNPTNNPEMPDSMVVTGTLIHEIDVMSWLLDDYFVKAQMLVPRSSVNSPKQIHDPQIMVLTTSKGIIVEVEAFIFCKYGYEVHCEIISETGTAKLPQPMSIEWSSDAKTHKNIMTDWKYRFIDAYDVEFQAWADALNEGKHSGGPDAWDGYKAAVTAATVIKAQESGGIEEIPLPEKPSFYN